MELLVDGSGNARCVYDETIPLRELGSLVISRGSHVEPIEPSGQWMADLAPVGGPVLGPFDDRSAALQAESAWLNRFWLVPKPT